MSEKRFTYGETIDYNFFDVFEEKKYLGMVQRDSTKIVDLLNQLNDENEQLKEQLKQKQEEEKLYAQEILKLNKTKKEMLNFKELGEDY